LTQAAHTKPQELSWPARPVPEAAGQEPESRIPVAVPAPAERRAIDWTHFLTLAGDAGRLWLEAYRQAGGMELRDWTEQALELLRRRRTGEALVLLARAEERVSSPARDTPGSVAHLMQRWYCAARAYHSYCREEFSEATEQLEQAHEAVCAAIEAEGCLLPLAMHSYEFRLQHARIARTRRRWPEMWRHLEIARGMLEDREPLCALSDGTAVDYSRLARFFGPLTAYDREDRKSLAAILEVRYRLRLHELQLHWIYAPAGFVIPYP
jgi:hypothetical protein